MLRPLPRLHPLPLLLQVQVSAEGFEPWAMKSAEHLLLDHLVENIYWEYRPNIWERQLEWGMAVHFPMAVGRCAGGRL